MLCIGRGGAPARRGGVGQPGEMGVRPGLPCLSTSLVIICWHRCGEKGLIACLCLPSPRPSVSVCLSIRPVRLWRSLPRGLSSVNPKFLVTLELGGERGRKAKETPAPKPAPELSGGSGCAEEPCHAGGGPPPLPFPLHGVEVASRPLLKCLTGCASRGTVEGPVSLSPPSCHVAWMGSASADDSCFKWGSRSPGKEPGALQGVSQ